MADKKDEKLNYKKAKLVDAKKLSSVFKKDKDNCGAREGSAHWAVWKVIQGIFRKGKPFTKEKLATKVKMFCKETKIKVNVDAKLPRSIPIFMRHGVIGATDQRGVYVKTI